MSISVFVKTTALYSIFIVSVLIIFQTSSNIANVLGSTIENPHRSSMASSNISFQLHDPKPEDLKKHFETGMEESNRDNWIFVNHDIYGTRNSNQTQIDESNVGDLKVK